VRRRCAAPDHRLTGSIPLGQRIRDLLTWDTPTVRNRQDTAPRSCGLVGRRGDNGAMSDDGSGQHVRQSPRKQAGDLRVADFTMMVRVPGQPAAVRVYADAERDEAARYAATTGGEAVPLPLSQPSAKQWIPPAPRSRPCRQDQTRCPP
jgi:hypothetical protein